MLKLKKPLLGLVLALVLAAGFAGGTALAAVPGTPANVTVTVGGASATISWGATATATGYKMTIDAETPVTLPSTSLAYTATNLAAGAHAYSLVATNADGDSAVPATGNFNVAAPTSNPTLTFGINIADLFGQFTNIMQQLWPVIAVMCGIPTAFWIARKVRGFARPGR